MIRQRKWQIDQVAKGNCMCCGKPREHYAHRCDSCHNKIVARERRRNGFKQWKPGSRGRPPIGSEYTPRTASGIRYRKRNKQ